MYLLFLRIQTKSIILKKKGRAQIFTISLFIEYFVHEIKQVIGDYGLRRQNSFYWTGKLLQSRKIGYNNGAVRKNNYNPANREKGDIYDKCCQEKV